MGLGEFGGNGSVVWNVVHEDDAGNPKSLTPVPSPADPGDDQVAVVPPATPGGPPRDARGKDPRAVAKIGELKGHTGKFRVKLRFSSKADLDSAVTPLRVTNVGPDWFLEIDVPALNRPNRHASPPLEVRVDW